MLNGYVPYDTISRGVWPHRGPCLLRLFVHNETCVLGFHVYTIYEFNNSLVRAPHAENIISKYSKTSD